MEIKQVSSKMMQMLGNTSSSSKNLNNMSKFHTVMKESMQSNNKSKKNFDASSQNKVSDNTNKNIQDTSNATASQSKVKSNTNQTNVTNKTGNEQADGTEKIEEISSEIKDNIKDILNLSEEELNEVMSVLGFTMLDLLNVNNLKQIVLQVNGESDLTAALTNEQLASNLTDVMQMYDALEQLDLSQEEIVSILETVKSQASQVIAPEEQMKGLQENQKERDPQNTQEDVIKEDVLTVQVEKETTFRDSQGSDLSQSPKDSKGQTTSTQTITVGDFVENLMPQNQEIQSFADQVAQVRQMREIVNQVVEQIKVSIKPGNTNMELTLNPESLGKVNFSVASKDGVLTAQFIVQNEVAKEAIESQIQVLKETLNTQELKVESIEVTIASFSFDQRGGETEAGSKEGQRQSRKSIKIDEVNSDSILNEEEKIAVDIMKQSGNQVDYTA